MNEKIKGALVGAVMLPALAGGGAALVAGVLFGSAYAAQAIGLDAGVGLLIGGVLLLSILGAWVGFRG
jgi:hypothetical protein